MKLRRMLCSILIVVILSVQCDIPVKANSDYLNISLADIVVTYFNASGVAIGEAELFNAIYNLWGNVTLENLIDNGVLVGSDASWSKEDIKDMLGYGNLSAPFIKVRQSALKSYLGEVPISNIAYDALDAMFNFDSPVTDGIFTALAVLIGDVANIGKIGYDLVSNVVEDFTGILPISTIKQAYQKFTDSTYFQDLLQSGGGAGQPSGDLILNFSSGEKDGIGGFAGSTTGAVFRVNRDVFGVAYPNRNVNNSYYVYIYNFSGGTTWIEYNTVNITGDNILNSPDSFNSSQRSNNSRFTMTTLDITDERPLLSGGYAIIYDGPYITSAELLEWARENNPWNNEGPGDSGNGVTNYINNSVGNIASDNYINLSPNIGTKEYLIIFDRLTYIENLNTITQNTDNGDYSQNSTVINNYNNQYIQNDIPNARPSTVPAENPENQPAQPFVSPRPTQPPEFVESVVQEGGLSEEITTKFPFCIPWDIKALIDNLWAPEARAPYIHWEATFGEWGKLGEVTLDFSEFDPAARIFRSTTLLLWIVGLVLITRDLIG